MLSTLAAVCVVWPGIMVVGRVLGAALRGTLPVESLAPSWGLLANTIGWAVGIGAFATLLALPAAWWIGRRGWGLAAFACAPLLLPTYLTYAAFGLIRAPQSVVGDWIEQRAQAGADWLPALAGRIVAVVGLSCWAWGIAALVVAAGVRSLPRDALTALLVDRCARVSRWWHIARMLRGWLATAVGAVALVMLGSAVPLHLADAPTYSVRVWYELSLSPGSPTAWASAWPLIVVAGIAAWVVARRTGPAPTKTADSVVGQGAGGRASAGGTVGMVLISVALPWVLLAGTVGNVQTLMNFWTLSGEALGASVLVAAGVGLAGVVIALCVWIALSSFDRLARRVAGLVMAVWLFGAFVPGVLVGQAVATAWRWRPEVLDSPVILALGHVARFGAVAGLLGCWLAAGESRAQREARLLDNATGLFGFLRAAAPGRWMGVLGAGLVCACLSLHEIETSVFLQPPGIPSLAQTLLGYLHYSRMADLSAAAVWMVGFGLLLAGLAGVVVARAKTSTDL